MENKGGWSPSPLSREQQTIVSNNNEHRRDLLEGLLFVEAGIDEDETVDIYTIRMGRMELIESGGEVFARTWLGEHAQRLIEWQPRRRHDDLSGIWYRPAQERPPRGKETPRKECTHAIARLGSASHLSIFSEQEGQILLFALFHLLLWKDRRFP